MIEIIKLALSVFKESPLIISGVIIILLIAAIIYQQKRLFKFARSEGAYEAFIMFKLAQDGMDEKDARESLNQVRSDANSKRSDKI